MTEEKIKKFKENIAETLKACERLKWQIIIRSYNYNKNFDFN